MESKDKVPGEQLMPSDRPPSSNDRDVGEEESSFGQSNVYQEVLDNVESPRDGPSHNIRNPNSLSQQNEMTSKHDNNQPSKGIKFNVIVHAMAEFMGVAENDSSDDDLDNIDHPDGVASDARISSTQNNEAYTLNGTQIMNTSSKIYHKKSSNHRKVWENRRYRLAARRYGGLKEGTDDIETANNANDNLNENSSHEADDHPDGFSRILDVMPVHTKSSFIEYSKETYLWLVQRCCRPNQTPYLNEQQNYFHLDMTDGIHRRICIQITLKIDNLQGWTC